MSHWKIVPLQRSLGKNAKAWDALNDSAFGSNPLLSSFFVNGLLVHFGDGTEYLCSLVANDTVRAMCIVKPTRPFVWASFLPSQAQVGPTLIPDVAMLTGLISQLPYSVFQLDLLCNDPAFGGVVSNAQPPTHRMNHALTMNLSLAGSFDTYWNGRSRKLQSNIRRYFQRVQSGKIALRMDILRKPIDIVDAVSRYGQLEAGGWKGAQGTALLSEPRQVSFYLTLLTGAAQLDQARVFELWLDNKLVASRLALVQGNMLVMLKTTYKESMAGYSPGRLLLRLVIEHAFEVQPGGMIEFYTDANPDQLAWATGSRWIQHSTIFRRYWGILPLTLLRLVRTKRNPPYADESHEPRIETFEHPDQLPAAVEKLMAQAEYRNVELGVAWYRNLVNTVYPNCPTLRFYVLWHGPQAVAALPVRVEKVPMGWRLHSLANYYTALYEPALAPNLKPREFVRLLAAIRRDFPGIASFRFTPMDPGSHGYQTLLAALRFKAWLPFEFFAFGNWYLPVQNNWKEYLAGRDGMLRSTLKRMSKKFIGDGGTLQLVSSATEMPAAIAAYQTVYANSWKKPEPFVEFLPSLLQTCFSKGWLRLGIAWLNGKPIAAQLWIVAGGRAEIYKLAYDEAFKSYAAGTLLSAMLMQHVLEVDQVREVDYLIGDDSYKKAWVSHRRERWGIIAYNPRSIRGLAGLGREVLGRWAKPWIAKFWTSRALQRSKQQQ